MFEARIMYLGHPSQCAEGFVSKPEAYQWLNAKATELVQLGSSLVDHEFVVNDPADMELWEDLTRI